MTTTAIDLVDAIAEALREAGRQNRPQARISAYNPNTGGVCACVVAYEVITGERFEWQGEPSEHRVYDTLRRNNIASETLYGINDNPVNVDEERLRTWEEIADEVQLRRGDVIIKEDWPGA